MTAHIHAALMLQYAQDAATTDKPWELWKIYTDGRWLDLFDAPSWDERFFYRRKPRTIRIGEYDVPEPMREAPEDFSVYYVPIVSGDMGTCRIRWANDQEDLRNLSNGLCHSTREAAELHAKALISLTAKP